MLMEAVYFALALIALVCAVGIYRLHSRVADLKNDLKLVQGRADYAQEKLDTARYDLAECESDLSWLQAHVANMRERYAAERERIMYDRDVARDDYAELVQCEDLCDVIDQLFGDGEPVRRVSANRPVRPTPLAWRLGELCEDDECELCTEVSNVPA